MRVGAILRALDEGRRRARYRGESLYRSLLEQDDRLAAAGFPRLTEWWRATLERFYASGRRRLVCRVGRKGTKSATMCRVAVNEALRGEHLLRPGDVGFVLLLSINVMEARQRIHTIKEILGALGVAIETPDGDIQLVDRPIRFAVRAARIGSVSGPTCLCLIADEVAKWQDEATGANPATEVLRSVRPAMATQQNAHEFMISSPWSTLDAHHDAVTEGDTERQLVAQAPTWIANPTITEDDTHGLEPDELTWLREYAAVPMGSTEHHFFDHRLINDAIDKTLVLPVEAAPGTAVTAGGDLAFVRDSAALVLVHRLGGGWDDPAARYIVADVLEERPEPDRPLVPSAVIAAFAAKLKEHDVDYLMADGHYRESAIEHLRAENLHFADAPSGAQLSDPYVRLRVLFAGSRVRLPNHPRLIRQLKEVTSQPTPSGAITIRSPRKAGGGHGDLVSALVLATWQRSGKRVADAPLTEAEFAIQQASELKRRALTKAAREQKRDAHGAIKTGNISRILR